MTVFLGNIWIKKGKISTELNEITFLQVKCRNMNLSLICIRLKHLKTFCSSSREGKVKSVDHEDELYLHQLMV